MTRYEDAFETLVARGDPIGATALLERVERDVSDVAHLARPPRRQWSGVMVAAVVFASVLVLGAAWALILRQGDDPVGEVDDFGVEWIRLSNNEGRLLSVTAGPGGFIRSSFSGTGRGLEFSSDGRSWSAVDLPGLTSRGFFALPQASTSTWMIPAGEDASASAWVSVDGQEWTAVVWPSGLDGKVSHIVASGGGFLAVSTDVFGAGTTVWWSADGETWIERHVEFPGDPLRDSIWGTAAGLVWTPGSPATGTSLPVYSSTDGADWTEGRIELPVDDVETPMRWWFRGFEHVGGQWIAIGTLERGSGDPRVLIWTSRDAIDWAPQEPPDFAEIPGQAVRLTERAASDRRLVVAPATVPVVVGEDGMVGSQGGRLSTGEVWATADGSSWFRLWETDDEINSLAEGVDEDGRPVGLWIPLPPPEDDDSAQMVETTIGITAAPQDLEQEGLDLQAEILADGAVTEQEFRRAMEGWKACMERQGLIEVEYEIGPQGLESKSYGSYDEFFDGQAEDVLCHDSYVARIDQALHQ